MLKRAIILGACCAALAALWAAHFSFEFVEMGSGFVAKTLCSGVFVSGREAAEVEATDIREGNTAIVRLFSGEIDRAGRSASASLFGLGHRVAHFVPGLGCSLVPRHGSEAADNEPHPRDAAADMAAPWPVGEGADETSPLSGEDRTRLDAALDAAFAETGAEVGKRTRAVVVVQHGRLLAERYAPGFSAETPLLGWSLAKVVTNALTGILIGKGKLSRQDRALFPEWRTDNDPRAGIAVNDLLQMRSGLSFHENYTAPLSDVRRMLFLEDDAAAFVAAKSSEFAPGTHWQNSGGDCMLLSRLARQVVGDEQAYREMPWRELFEPLGMRTAVLERDPSGTFVGSSFAYASARDWARLGQLYLQDGIWNGRQLLPAGWVGYARTGTTASDGRYGAGLWRELPETGSGLELPADAFFMLGYDGQLVAVIPSYDAVIVRMGLSRPSTSFDPAKLVFDVLQALHA